jgi:uncharacterized protein YbjT (DUF2867 family)
MKAFIIGATGATGKDLLNVLLQHPDYSEVTIFARRTSGIVHPKLKEVLTDFDKPEDVSELIKGNVWFSCLGTTLKAAGSKEQQWKIDFDIPAKFAAIAKQNGVRTTVLLSAYGASPTSKVFYSKMKGELEEYIDELSFKQYIIFRPGLLLRKDTDRFGERISGSILNFVNSIGLLKKFKPMPTSVLAEKLAKAPTVFPEGKHIVELNKIFEF